MTSASRDHGAKSKTSAPRPRRLSAARAADKHRLYEQSVQNTEAEYDFIDQTFSALRDRNPLRMREDFCGTARMCCEWVSRRDSNQAIGVDLDESVLQWAERHNIADLPPGAAQRIRLVQGNVLNADAGRFDVVLAMNFSYQLFKDRRTLKRYFRRVRDSLVDDGVFFLDAYGGYDSYRTIREKRACDGFTYIWDQASYNPISGEMLCHIHFTFPDGSRLRRAFSYDWRLWTLPEIRELLAEAGFTRITVYWQGFDPDTGEGDGVFVPAEVAESDPGWICYLTAEK